jgi:hypothetical protein
MSESKKYTVKVISLVTNLKGVFKSGDQVTAEQLGGVAATEDFLKRGYIVDPAAKKAEPKKEEPKKATSKK